MISGSSRIEVESERFDPAQAKCDTMLLMSDLFKNSALAVMLLAILLACYKGRHAVSADGRSLAWTHVPLICVLDGFHRSKRNRHTDLSWLQIRSVAGRTIRISIFIIHCSAPLDFAVMNWGFVALYVTCRLSPNFGSAQSAVWLSATLMSFLNVPLFFLAPEMVSNVYDAGKASALFRPCSAYRSGSVHTRLFLIPTLALLFLSLRRSHRYRSWV